MADEENQTFKKTKSLKAGTIALSEGVTHFNPNSDREAGRYQTGVFKTEDALRAEAKGLVEITGDADLGDFEAYKARCALNLGQPGTARGKTVEIPPEGSGSDEDDDDGLPPALKLSIKNMRPVLAEITDMDVLKGLYAAEKGRGEASRPSALEEIERRANQIDNEGFDAFKAELDQEPETDPDAPPA